MISSLFPRYLASKSKNSFWETISVRGKVTISSLLRKTPTVISLPFINSSTNTCSSSLKAFSMAFPSSSEGWLTFDMPMLDPPLLGFTKTGKRREPARLSGLSKRSLMSRTDRATCMPPAPATAMVKRLLNVNAEVAASQEV